MWKKNSVRFSAAALLSVFIAVPGISPAQGQALPGEIRDAEKAVRLQDYSRAFRLYSRAASNGSSEAQYQLANLYHLGRGVKKNPAKQRFWLEKAAAAGHAAAQYSLAQELGRESSLAERAAELVEAAAAAGFAPAKLYLQRIGSGGVAGGADPLDVTERWFAAARKNQLDVLGVLRKQVDSVDLPDSQQRTALSVAVAAGSSQAVNWLLQRGADPAHRDRFGKSAAFIAIDGKRQSLLKQLLAAGLKPTVTLPNGDTLLHYAVRRNRVDMLSTLLDKGVPINRHNRDGWTALDLARFANNGEAVTLLRKHGGKRGEGWQSDDDRSPTMMAARWSGDRQPDMTELAKIVSAGNGKLLRQLAAGRTELLNRPLRDGTTLLAIAIANGQPAMVDTLLDLGARPDTGVAGKMTALQWAAQSGQQAIALSLLQRGVAVATVDEDGHDAVELALLAGHAELARAIMDHHGGAPALTPDRYAYTAARADAAGFVRAVGPRLHHTYRDRQGRSALWYAASYGDADMIADLIRYGVRDDTPDSGGKTPLLVAVERGCLRCVARLAAGADLDRQTPSGETPLIIAAGRSDRALVSWLVANGVDIHRRNTLGDSALLVAVRANAVDVARALVKAGASVSRKNRMGLSARDIAKQKGPEMVAALASG